VFEAGLFSFLTAQPTLQALLGTSAARGDKSTGVFAVLANNEATMPYMVFQKVSGEPVMSLQGMNALQKARFRFSCYGTSYVGAVALSNALKILFATLLTSFSDGTVIRAVQMEMEMDDTESIPHGTIYARHSDWMFMYVEGS
jgi:hypothetical protein